MLFVGKKWESRFGDRESVGRKHLHEVPEVVGAGPRPPGEAPGKAQGPSWLLQSELREAGAGRGDPKVDLSGWIKFQE